MVELLVELAVWRLDIEPRLVELFELGQLFQLELVQLFELELGVELQRRGRLLRRWWRELELVSGRCDQS